MRKFTGWAFALAMAFATTAMSAENRLVPEEGALEVMLLRQKSVREDLKLSHDEADKINKFTSQQWKKAQEYNALPDAERDKKFAALTKENHEFVEQVLKTDQRERLKEIELQVAGLLCVTRDDVAKKLNLTEEQKKRAKELQREARQEMEDFIYSESKTGQKEKLAEIKKTSRNRLNDLLTDEQEKTWAKMTGKPFTGNFEFGSTTASSTK